MRSIQSLRLLFAALGAAGSLACEAGGVGDPCIPEDEYNLDFGGAEVSEVNVESKSFQCETRVCLSAYFNGRVSCPYGQQAPASGPNACYTPGYTPGSGNDSTHLIRVDVPAQYTERRPDKAVYCSCRCNGPDKGARYCECPDGYTCQQLIPDLGISSGQLAGSYCVKKSAVVTDPTNLKSGVKCTGTNCGTDLHPTY